MILSVVCYASENDIKALGFALSRFISNHLPRYLILFVRFTFLYCFMSFGESEYSRIFFLLSIVFDMPGHHRERERDIQTDTDKYTYLLIHIYILSDISVRRDNTGGHRRCSLPPELSRVPLLHGRVRCADQSPKGPRI